MIWLICETRIIRKKPNSAYCSFEVCSGPPCGSGLLVVQEFLCPGSLLHDHLMLEITLPPEDVVLVGR